MIPNKCVVIREGKEKKINATELVKGDLIRLTIGDRIPADVRIVDTNDLKVWGARVFGLHFVLEISSMRGERGVWFALVLRKSWGCESQT